MTSFIEVQEKNLQDSNFFESYPRYHIVKQKAESFWNPLLPETAVDILRMSIDAMLTMARDKWFQIRYSVFIRGVPANAKTGFNGIMPIIEVSEKTFWKYVNLLVRVGILIKSPHGYRLRFACTATEIAQYEECRKSVTARRRRDHQLGTDEGIMQWAAKRDLLAAGTTLDELTGEVCEAAETHEEEILEADTNKTEEKHRVKTHSPYTFHIRTIISSGYTYPSEICGLVLKKVKAMKSRSAKDIISAAQGEYQARRNRLQAKQRASGNIASRVHLAEDAWRRGQIERDNHSLPARLSAKDRKLVKDHIIYASAGLDLDPNEFLHWCAVNWDAIGVQYFPKAKSYPSAPALPWLIKCSATYSRAFTDRDNLIELTDEPKPMRSLRQEKMREAEMEDLKHQLAHANRELRELRKNGSVDFTDDDPIFKEVAELASKYPKLTQERIDEIQAQREALMEAERLKAKRKRIKPKKVKLREPVQEEEDVWKDFKFFPAPSDEETIRMWEAARASEENKKK